MDSGWFITIAIIAIAIQASALFLALFEPSLRYKITETPQQPLDSDEFLHIVSTVAGTALFRCSKVEVLTNGEVFYEAELEAIRQAQSSINIEAYIFQKGDVTRRLLEALAERAKAGVRVNVVLDTVGSFASWNRYFRELREAGGRVEWYHPFRWHMLGRINNRTHREIIVIDCKIGFVGGAGFADHWLIGRKKHPRWRDTMFRIEGDAVSGLQAVFVENWLEASGELLSGEEYFCFPSSDIGMKVMVLGSNASSGRSTRARMVYQTLMAAARERIEITTPYFLPDAGVRAELIRAMRERGVSVRIVAPGKHSDHLLTRRSSRRLYGDLLEAGAEIYEYQPSMIHTKTMTIDGIWSVAGSTNFDHRSFSINDEVNLLASNRGFAARVHEDFVMDVAQSERITLKNWRKRGIFERLHEGLGRLLERQQ